MYCRDVFIGMQSFYNRHKYWPMIASRNDKSFLARWRKSISCWSKSSVTSCSSFCFITRATVGRDPWSMSGWVINSREGKIDCCWLKGHRILDRLILLFPIWFGNRSQRRTLAVKACDAAKTHNVRTMRTLIFDTLCWTPCHYSLSSQVEKSFDHLLDGFGYCFFVLHGMVREGIVSEFSRVLW